MTETPSSDSASVLITDFKMYKRADLLQHVLPLTQISGETKDAETKDAETKDAETKDAETKRPEPKMIEQQTTSEEKRIRRMDRDEDLELWHYTAESNPDPEVAHVRGEIRVIDPKTKVVKETLRSFRTATRSCDRFRKRNSISNQFKPKLRFLFWSPGGTFSPD